MNTDPLLLYRQSSFARVGIYENDIATLMQLYEPGLDPLFAELSKHLTDNDLTVVRDIVHEIQQRIARFRERYNLGSQASATQDLRSNKFIFARSNCIQIVLSSYFVPGTSVTNRQ